MPYKRSYKRKGSRNGYRRKTSAVKRNSRKIARITNKVETKHCDMTAINFGVDDSTVAANRWILLNGMAQGLTSSDRIGLRVTMTSFDGKVEVRLGTTPTDAYCKLALVIDSRPNGALPTNGSYMEQTGIGIAPIALQQRDWDSRQRFRTLWQKEFTITTEKPQRTFKIHKIIPKLWRQIHSVGSGALIGNIIKHSLLWFVQGDQPVGATAPRFNYSSRLKYQDA